MYRSIGGGIFAAASLVGPADEGSAAAGAAGDVNGRTGSQGDGISQHFDGAAAFTSPFAGGVKGAGVGHTAPFQADNAVDMMYALRLYHTAVIDNGVEKFIFGAGAHDHQTAL